MTNRNMKAAKIAAPNNKDVKMTNALLMRREEFAVAAMQGFCSRRRCVSFEQIAKRSLKQANALIKELYDIDLSDIVPTRNEE